MSEPSSETRPEHLLAHEPWLGALARRLVRDEDEAADVVQETLRRALEAPPREASSLRSFLAAIARHFAYDGSRRKRRREQRELCAARAEQTPATVDLLARLDRQRDVLGEVLELEEPFREAVLLRYYEELKPRVIAKRLGIPVTTVKSRLRRGQERLRARLQARYGECEWRAAIAPLLALPATPLGVAAVPFVAVLATAAALSAGAWQLSFELGSREPRGSAPAMPRVAAMPSAVLGSTGNREDRGEDVPRFERRAAESARSVRPAVGSHAGTELVRWPEESLLWIDLERGVLSAPANDLCAIGSELLASPRAVADALAAGRGGVLFLPRVHDAKHEAPERDEALELHVLDAAGRAAQDLPVRVLWRGDGAQRVLWRGRTHDGRVSAPGLKSAIERLMPRGEILASFDFPLADVRACVLSARHAAGEMPCLQAPPSGALRIVLRDPWGAELAPGACAVLRARQPDGSTWEHALEWHAGEARFAPIALGAELEIEVRAPDLPPAVRRIEPLFDASAERTVEIVAGRPGSRCAGRLRAVGASALLDRSGLAEVCDESGGVLTRWRFDLDEHGGFACALNAAAAFDPRAATRLRLWVGSALAEVPFAYPAPGQTLELGEIALEPALELARGRVVDESGAPLALARVRVDRERRFEGEGPRLWLPHAHARTDAAGRFRLCGAGSTADRFEISVEAPGRYFERRALVPASAEPLELVAQNGGALEGEARFDPSIDAAMLAVLVHPSTGPLRVAKLESNGAFRIDGLPPGYATIDLVSTLGEGPPLVRSAPCCIAAGGTAHVVPLDARERFRALERRALDGRGPYTERAIELRGMAVDGPWTWRGRTDRDGCFRFLLPIEVDALDLVIEGDPRLRFDAREAHGWVDLAAEVVGR